MNHYLFPNDDLLPSHRVAAVLGPASARRARSRWASVRFAWQGLREAWRTQPNLRLHAAAGAVVAGLGVWCRLSATEWMWVTVAIGLVVFAELMNTAIEQTIDLVVGARLDPHARRAKDLSAGFVLVAAANAVVIGAVTFGPHLLNS
jgi:diacylglycerol kinase